MAPPVLFGCVGGFLGAGKTTAIAASAREIRARGLAVGVVAGAPPPPGRLGNVSLRIHALQMDVQV
jgi:molybdopterin-guanine dinucleotide biosynthesis protein